MAEPTNTPIPASTPRSASPALLSTLTLQTPASPLSPTKLSTLPKARILHIGRPFTYARTLYVDMETQSEVIRPLEGDELVSGLREGKWGDFRVLIWTPCQGERIVWDAEMVSLLPRSLKLFATPGSVADVDSTALGERGIMLYGNSGDVSEKRVEAEEKKQQESCLEYVVAMLVMSHMMKPPAMRSRGYSS